jgi:hypothetical protein
MNSVWEAAAEFPASPEDRRDSGLLHAAESLKQPGAKGGRRPQMVEVRGRGWPGSGKTELA